MREGGADLRRAGGAVRVAMMMFAGRLAGSLHVFLASIGVMILLNLGSNYFFGEIFLHHQGAVRRAPALAVTMDYSIFSGTSYNEQRETGRQQRKPWRAPSMRRLPSSAARHDLPASRHCAS